MLSPMTSLDYDTPRSVAARVERGMRRVVTRRLIGEVKKVAATGTRVTLLGPGREDLEAFGGNLMDPSRRTRALETSLRTSAAALRRARCTRSAEVRVYLPSTLPGLRHLLETGSVGDPPLPGSP